MTARCTGGPGSRGRPLPEKYPTSMVIPALVDGDRPRLIGTRRDHLYVNTLDEPQFLLSKELNPKTYWSASSVTGEFAVLPPAFQTGRAPVPFRGQGMSSPAWAGKQKDERTGADSASSGYRSTNGGSQ